jgi:tripartite-type tricarboxylate transporter receptor subunit TctC
MLNTIKKVALASAMVLSAGAAMAEYPEKPIEVIVGYSAGGGTDVMAHTTMPFIEKYLVNGASIVVKNMPGASGQIGITEVANSKSDGYTLGTFNLSGMMSRTTDRETGYDCDSFTYLADVVNDPNVIVSAKGSAINSMEDLIAAAKENPIALTVGMSYLGGDDHFLLIKLQKMTETEFTIVRVKGSAPARSDVMGGHVAVGIFNVSEVAKFQGELNVLGVAQPDRSPFAPEVPTFREQGLDLINGSMREVVAPAGLPDDVANALRAAFEKAAQDPEFINAMYDRANPVAVVTGPDFRELTDGLFDLAKETFG